MVLMGILTFTDYPIAILKIVLIIKQKTVFKQATMQLFFG